MAAGGEIERRTRPTKCRGWGYVLTLSGSSLLPATISANCGGDLERD